MGAFDFIDGSGPGAVAGRTAMAGIVGGTASALGGGKFANGAYTAAFQHLLNFEAPRARLLNRAEDLLNIAKGELGVAEILGPENNPRVIEYHSTTSLAPKFDKTPWCSSFVNWVMDQAGVTGTNSAWALDWKTWGKGIDEPALGALAVFRHPDGTGHVGFVAGTTPSGMIRVLGGNQLDTVMYRDYNPNSPSMKLVAYRVPNISNRALIVPPVFQDSSAGGGSTR
jgi:uncharacterized protein (TIGR02594 family)